MNVRTWQTSSEEETIEAGRELAELIARPAVLLLIGNLGAGKTTLTKGLVNGLGAALPDEVSSPTFTLIHEYAPGIWHLDLYRLETDAELLTLGLDDLMSDSAGVLIVEWGEKFRSHFPRNAYVVTLFANSPESRTISVDIFL